MRFIITAGEAQINKMCADLDNEKKALEKKMASRQFKTASKLIVKIIKIPLHVIIDYKRLSKQKIELTVTTSAAAYMKETAVSRMIKKRVSDGRYGTDVKIEVVK